MENHQKSKLNIKQRFSYGLGNILNEILLYMYLSFSIIFLMRVVGLSASQAGLAMLIGQITDAFTSPITGFLGDRVQIPFISKKLGRRKSWHLVGTVMMAGGLPLLFNRCLVCNDYQGVSWLQPFYYYCIMVIINAACNILEINHLSITFTAAGTVQEGAALTAIRLTAITVFFLFSISWIWCFGFCSLNECDLTSGCEYILIIIAAKAEGCTFLPLLFFIFQICFSFSLWISNGTWSDRLP